MDLTGIISISGKPGLFKMVGQMKNGIIVESLEDNKRFPAYASHKVSALDDISIYGYSEDVPLVEVFVMMYKLEEGKETLDSNKASIEELRARLREAFAEFDEERVYASDLKKLFKWYNLLLAQGLIDDKVDEPSEEGNEADSSEENESKED